MPTLKLNTMYFIFTVVLQLDMESCEIQCQGSVLHLLRYRDWTIVNVNTGSLVRSCQSNWVKKATYDHISWAENKSWPNSFLLSPKNKNGCKSQMPVFISYTDALLWLHCYKSIQNADYSKGMPFHTWRMAYLFCQLGVWCSNFTK